MINFRSYKLENDSAVDVVELTGSLDTEACEYFFSCVEELIESGNDKLIIDCHGVDYVSSLGLGMLMRTHSRMKKRGGDVKLARIEKAVADIFAAVGFDRILQLYGSVDEAHQSFG